MFIKLLNHTQQKWYTCIHNLSLWIKIYLTMHKGPQQSGRGRDGIRGKSPRGESKELELFVEEVLRRFFQLFCGQLLPSQPLYSFIHFPYGNVLRRMYIHAHCSPPVTLFSEESYKKERIWTLLDPILTQVCSSRSYDKCVQWMQKNVKCQIRI